MAFDRKDWKEFRETGLFHFVNSFLHMFGWAIVVAVEEDGTVSAVYPARTDFRGFSVESNDKAYARVTAFMQKEFGPAAESKTESLAPKSKKFKGSK